jgi:hypothetical protein
MSTTEPPFPNVDTFNNLYWTPETGAGLTRSQADKLYLKFPVSQNAKETISGPIDINGIATFTNDLVINNNKKITQTLANNPTALNTLANTEIRGITTLYDDLSLNNCSINQALANNINETNFLIKTSISSGFGQSQFHNFEINDSVSGNDIMFLPNAANGNYNVLVTNGNQCIISGGTANTESLCLTTHSNTCSGVKINPTSTLIGSGGSTLNDPATSLLFDGTNINVKPNLRFPDTTVQTTAWNNTINVTDNNTDANFFPVFVNGAGTNRSLFIDAVTGPFTINPSTGTMNLPTIRLDGGSTQRTSIGFNAGITNPGIGVTSFGRNAGQTNQGQYSTAVGWTAGGANLGQLSVALGAESGGSGQFTNYIGRYAIGTHNNCNVINAQNSNLATDGASRFYVSPIRNDTTKQTQLQYNTTSKEISYVNQVISPITTSGLDITGNAALLSATAGGTSGQHLVIVVNGVTYKIKLENP